MKKNRRSVKGRYILAARILTGILKMIFSWKLRIEKSLNGYFIFLVISIFLPHFWHWNLTASTEDFLPVSSSIL